MTPFALAVGRGIGRVARWWRHARLGLGLTLLVGGAALGPAFGQTPDHGMARLAGGPATGQPAAQVATPTPTAVAGGAMRSGQPADLVLGQPGFTSRGLASTANGLAEPNGVAVDPTSGKVFVADTANNRVVRYAALAALSQGAAAEGVLGQVDLAGHDSATTARRLAGPMGVSVDQDGRLWVADTDNRRVLRFDDAAGKPNGAPADGVVGQSDFTSRASAVTARGLAGPAGLAVDAGGRLWVVDRDNNRLLRFDGAASKANGAPADGVLGQMGFGNSGDGTSRSRLSAPWGVATDGAGRLWLADRGNQRVLRFDNAASKPNGANADGVLGQSDFSSQRRATTPSGLINPHGVVLEPGGRLWVADAGNNRVLWYDAAASKPNGGAADGVLGQRDLTSQDEAATASGLAGPRGLALDGEGGLWVTDMPQNRVLHYRAGPAAGISPATTTTSGIRSSQPAALVLGQVDFSGSGASASPTGLNNPSGVAVDPTTGKVFVADLGNQRVLRFPNLTATRSAAPAEAVLGQADFTSTAPATTRTGFSDPTGLAIDANGRLWVVDASNNRVLRFDNAATRPNGAPADGVLGQPDFTSNAPGSLNYPQGVAVDVNGGLWVADTFNARIVWYQNAASKPNGAIADDSIAFSFGAPVALALDQRGAYWIADTANHRVIDLEWVRGADGTVVGLLGQSTFAPGTGPATTQAGMNLPTGVAFDASGRLWVVDSRNNRVLWFDDAGNKGQSTTGNRSMATGDTVTAANADGVLGQSDFTSSVTGTSANGFRGPTAVTVDSRGQVWVADALNNRVLRFDPAP